MATMPPKSRIDLLRASALLSVSVEFTAVGLNAFSIGKRHHLQGVVFEALGIVAIFSRDY
jgi:hypothetical protein